MTSFAIRNISFSTAKWSFLKIMPSAFSTWEQQGKHSHVVLHTVTTFSERSSGKSSALNMASFLTW